MKFPLLLTVLLLSASVRVQAAAPAPASDSAAEKDLRELVRQPSKDWQAKHGKPKVNVLLLIDKTKIRKGEPFGYRIETQNDGKEPLAFNEPAPSFIKEGSLCGVSAFKIYVTPPGGKAGLAPCAPKSAVQTSTGTAAEPETGLALTLQPGEYLLTRPSGPANRFRPLLSAASFDAVGTYSFKVVYEPKGGARATSNTVTLEVVP
jgi:hypothetical protein